MGILIIDGSCVYEVDEECLKTHRMPEDCKLPPEVWKHLDTRECVRIELEAKNK